MTERRRTIIRAAHGEEQPYFMLLRSVAQDVDLSYEALGLLTYLLSKPTDWQVHPDTLMRKKTGRVRVYKLLKELREAGHVQRVVHRDDKKHITQFEYVVYEQPLPIRERDLVSTKQEIGKQDIGNGHNTEYRETQKKERDTAPELPDHISPATRRVLQFPEAQAVQPDGNAAAYALVEAYCDAWSVTDTKYRNAWHKKHAQHAKVLAELEATPDEIKAMVAERRAKGKQPDECPMKYLASDYVEWKLRRQSEQPAANPAAERAALEAAERARLEWDRERAAEWAQAAGGEL